MARVGSFGRRRPSGQNLMALIAALLREQQQATDRAAFDAYQNGGKFQGKPMTDARFIAYLKGRRDGYTKGEPDWDIWNNRVIQTRFSVGEQEIGLKFKRGQVSAGAVAAWYRRQLEGIPRNSEFYRTVAGRAADWAKAASSAARGAASASARSSLMKKRDRLNERIQDNQALIGALTTAAKRAGLISGNEQLTDADASDLRAWLDNGVTVNGERVTFGDWRRCAISTYNAIGAQVPIYKQMGWGPSKSEGSEGLPRQLHHGGQHRR
jgi:hypothetical protein